MDKNIRRDTESIECTRKLWDKYDGDMEIKLEKTNDWFTWKCVDFIYNHFGGTMKKFISILGTREVLGLYEV